MTDRDLVRQYWPTPLRAGFDSLFAIDDALAEIVLRASQPALAAITLAWWREALERLDHSPPPSEPRLQDAARELLRRGLTGRALSDLEGAWAGLLEEGAGVAAAEKRGRALFGLAGKLLENDENAEGAGALFGRADLLRRTGDPRWRGQPPAQMRWPRSLRPLTAFDALAARDLRNNGSLEIEATPARAWTLIRHRLTGRI